MIPPLLRPRPGPFQVVAAATVGYERRRWSGTSVRHPRRWNREGAPTWPRGRDVTHPRFHFGPRHRHRSASSWYLWRSCTVISIGIFFPSFFFFSNPRCTLSTHVDPYLPPWDMYIVVLYTLYREGGDIYIYKRWDGGKRFGIETLNFQKFLRLFEMRSLKLNF